MDDQRLGSAFRAVRIRRGWRQLDVAKRAEVARSVVTDMERGWFEDKTLKEIRRVAEVLDIRVDVVARWHGGDLDRLLNRRHSSLHEAAARRFLLLPGWQLFPEVTFAFYADRGVIDILAWHAASGSLLVIELKSELVDLQEMVGTLDRKARVAFKVAAERGLPKPASVSRWLIVADTRTNRRHMAMHRTMLRNAFPLDGRAMGGWLAEPGEAVAVASFMPYVATGDLSRSLTAVRRVRGPRTGGITTAGTAA